MRKYPGYPAKPTKAALQLAAAAQAPAHLVEQLMPPVREPRAKSGRPEEKLQVSLVKQLRAVLDPHVLVHHSPNGGRRSVTEGARFKAMGTMAGWPDLTVIHAGRAYFAELKADKGAPTVTQQLVHSLLTGSGCPVAVWRSPEDMMASLRAWGLPMRGK